MKPHRVQMAHSLIVRYGLHEHMEVWYFGAYNLEFCGIVLIIYLGFRV
jgi:hypothetical protein